MSDSKNKRKLLTIFAWFFIPLAIATAGYNLGMIPSGKTNNGQLLEPFFTLTEFSYQTIDGDSFSNKEVEKVWTLLHFIEGECDAACSESLYNTRQMRISFGKDIDRIDRVAVLSSAVKSESNQKMWASHPDLKVLIGTGKGIGRQIKNQLTQFDRSSNAVYLLDPLGNVVMRFPATLEVKLMKKDIRKLLKLSHIG